MADIIELILADHRRIRRLAGALHDSGHRDSGAGDGPGAGQRVGLAGRPDRHVPQRGGGDLLAAHVPPGRTPGQIRNAAAAVADLREGIAEARLQPAGSPCWWRAVSDTLRGTLAQLGREEHDILPGFARRAGPALRGRLARQWLTFHTALQQDQALPSSRGTAVCQQPLPGSHPHLLDARKCAILCTCPACARVSAQTAMMSDSKPLRFRRRFPRFW
jgi:hypothetical protein